MEAAIVERLRRSDNFKLHPGLLNAPLIYDQHGKQALIDLYQEYVDIADQHNLPIFLLTPTWKANYSRVELSDISKSINIDAVNFLAKFKSVQSNKNNIKICGLIGPKNDCYSPDEGLSVLDSKEFHTWQIEQLAAAGVDYLIAETLPNVGEALGIAMAMELVKIPYIISFVIDRNGLILDGTSLTDAIEYIDSNVVNKPFGYMVNCAYPSFLNADKQPKNLFKRLIGYQANASSLDHCDLDGTDKLKMNDISEWGNLMLELNSKHGMEILGGCCGTNGKHLEYLAKNNITRLIE
jgi:S-methylmethionine-dependent homocysteine/selenocysteine methylase